MCEVRQERRIALLKVVCVNQISEAENFVKKILEKLQKKLYSLIFYF